MVPVFSAGVFYGPIGDYACGVHQHVYSAQCRYDSFYQLFNLLFVGEVSWEDIRFATFGMDFLCYSQKLVGTPGNKRN
jgi:hypothetical protein